MSKDKEVSINQEITAKEVRVIDDTTGDALGVISLAEALQKAEDMGVDLVEISPNANPPVCKLMDFGKFKYREQKKAHDMKAKQKKVHVKEIKMRPVTDDHDYQIKLRNAKRFLADGDKVKLVVQFRGRELAHQELGLKFLERATADLEDVAVIEMPAKFEGRNAMMIVAPSKKSPKKDEADES